MSQDHVEIDPAKLVLFPTVEALAASGFLFRIVDNGGATADRYTVTFCDGDELLMSAYPSSPQGVSMWNEGGDVQVDAEAVEAGTAVDLCLGDLDESVRRHIVSRLNEGFRDYLEAQETNPFTDREAEGVEPWEGIVTGNNHLFKTEDGFMVRDDEHGDNGPFPTAREALLQCLPEDYSLSGPEYHSTVDVASLTPNPEAAAQVAGLEGEGCDDLSYADAGETGEDVAVQVSPDGGDKPWIAEFAIGGVMAFATEAEACAYQRGWRVRMGLDPLTGEPAED